MCKVDGCNRNSMYVKDDVCQKHYFRFMRNGTYDTVTSRKYRRSNPKGYQLLFMPNHPLSQSNGYVYEHRYVVYCMYGDQLPDCELCGKGCDWKPYTTHIDHKDNDVTNNEQKNLRPLCNACNSRRDYPEMHDLGWCSSIEYKGLTLTSEEWSRDERVSVRGKTIRARIAKGWSVEDSLLKPSSTVKRVK